MMTIYLSRSFPRSNSSFFLCSGNALKSEVLRLREDIFLMDAGLGTPRICMQDEPTGVPINRTTRFENKVGSLDIVAGESLIKKHILERFFIDLVAGESLIKERAAARFKKLVGSTDVVAGEPLLLLPRRFRKNRAWMKLNKIWRTNTKPFFGATFFFPRDGVGAIQLCLVHLRFAFAGLPGKTLFFVPWGRGTPISSYWVLRTLCLLLLGLTIRQSLVSMNTGDLMDAVLPFLTKGAAGEITAGPGGSLPDPSGGGPIFPLLPQNQRDEDAGSPVWGALSPIQELPSIEGGEVVDLEAGPSNCRQEAAPEPKKGRFVLDDRIREWKPDYERDRFRPSEPEQPSFDSVDILLIDCWKKRMLKLLCSKELCSPIKVSKKKWEDALVKLHEAKGPYDWLANGHALERERERCPFFLQLLEEVQRFKVSPKRKR